MECTSMQLNDVDACDDNLYRRPQKVPAKFTNKWRWYVNHSTSQNCGSPELESFLGRHNLRFSLRYWKKRLLALWIHFKVFKTAINRKPTFNRRLKQSINFNYASPPPHPNPNSTHLLCSDIIGSVKSKPLGKSERINPGVHSLSSLRAR